ncbi:outer membrane protein assembly factor BamB precursor [Roseovarius sp. A-2]|uniref:PQQ-like beta-propeller repeat protein n=1 Tax=Roseovarius sp. A-2 TaxID=1570360 RepID=UPI0009D00367|nr:PQQ-like beta-propeller repeat protein [Roseovarius sp. A-2]GAW36094.1 outer membrane protein assembly factor BamB precursor [Roseovarius sp. A-2]
MTAKTVILGVATMLALTACSKQEAILSGEREGIRDVLQSEVRRAQVAETPENQVVPVALPPATMNADWTQRIGTPATRVAHPALSGAPELAWSVNIGAGDSRRRRITADPVVAGGRIFTLDAQALVRAVSTSGEVVWSADLTPPADNSNQASGGGLAYGDGKLFVSSAFGLLTALDPETGTQIWQQDLDAPTTAAPTVYDGRVYVVAGDDVAWVLDTATGRIDWQLSATPDIHNVLGGPAPALTEKYAVFAFGAGELQGAFRQGGLRLWDAQIAGQRLGVANARVLDITGDPVVVGDRVFAGSHAGRMVALRLGSGNRIWTANEGPLNPVWPAGESLFMVTDRNELVRLSAQDGTRIWGHELPLFEARKPKRQAQIVGHFGPVIAGGQLILASGDGQLRFFDPASGQMTRSVALPGGATSNPVVAGGTLYVVSKKGQLLAFR